MENGKADKGFPLPSGMSLNGAFNPLVWIWAWACKVLMVSKRGTILALNLLISVHYFVLFRYKVRLNIRFWLF